MFCGLPVLGIPLLPLPGGQCSGEPLPGGALQRLAAEGIILLFLLLAGNFANALLITGLFHSETFLLSLRMNVVAITRDT